MSSFLPNFPLAEVKCDGTSIKFDSHSSEPYCVGGFLTRTCLMSSGDDVTVSITTTEEGGSPPARINIHSKNCRSLAIVVENPKRTLIGKDLVLVELDGSTLVFPVKATCYSENELGPYRIRELELAYNLDEKVEVLLDKTPENAVCDINVLLAENASAEHVRPEYLKRLRRGYVDDALIWALVRARRVKISELPEYIGDSQAYYWPRGDIHRDSIYTWYSHGDSTSFLVYLELLEQIADQMNEHGGILIPYITAARMRNVYGAPQQLYAFEALYRGYQILGRKLLEKKALKALECFLVQPPKCLGYYEVGDGVWFRWGSYHYLSSEPDKRENLLVLNTHLMGVLGFAEAFVLTGEPEYREIANRGVKALLSIIDNLRDSSGYFHYGLFTKKALGKFEKILRPDLLGYHVLSSELLTKIGRLLGDESLVKLGIEGCLYGYKQLKKGKTDVAQPLLKCLVECYKASKSPEYTELIISTLKHVESNILILGYTLDECEQYLPPAIKLKGTPSIMLLHYESGLFSYLVCSLRDSSRIAFHDKRLPSGVEIRVEGIEAREIRGNWRRVDNTTIETDVGTCLLVDAYVSYSR